MATDLPNDSLLDLQISAFLDAAGHRQPTPGGGAVAALAVGARCVDGQNGYGVFTNQEKPAPEDGLVIDDIERQLSRLDRLIRGLVDEDAAAYEAYSQACKQAHEQDTQQALKLATSVPMEVMAAAVGLLRFDESASAAIQSPIAQRLGCVRSFGSGGRAVCWRKRDRECTVTGRRSWQSEHPRVVLAADRRSGLVA